MPGGLTHFCHNAPLFAQIGRICRFWHEKRHSTGYGVPITPAKDAGIGE